MEEQHNGFHTNFGLSNSSEYNFTLAEEEYYLYNVDHHLPSKMELDRQYIKDYDEYLSVLQDCNRTIHSTPYPQDGHVYCNATWDKMQCWDYTPSGSTVYQYCPSYIALSNPLSYSTKTCNQDGTWFRHPKTDQVWTNYSMCYDHNLVEKHKRVIYMYYYGFSISIVLLVISLFIFSFFRQLKCVRVTLHKHLFLSYVLTGALWIAYYRLVPMNSEVVLDNPVWCQILHVLTHFFTVCNYAWMFCEGFYLHALIVITFTKDKKLLFICYIIGWVFPVIPVLIYTFIRVFDEEENKRCWTGETSLNWILLGPITASLIVNFIFSINIMRILWSKLRSVHTNETMQTRRAVRATLILIPLLGLQYIAFPFKPPPGAAGEHVYAMISAFLVSFQGVFVSVVFCFFNGEVVGICKKRWHRRRTQSSIYSRSTRKTDLPTTMEGTTLIDNKGDKNANEKGENANSKTQEAEKNKEETCLKEYSENGKLSLTENRMEEASLLT